VLSQAREMGAVQLGLSGGEPLLRDDLEVIVAHAHKLGFYVNLITSGVGLNEQRAGALKDAGLDHIQLSFQDSTRELNDLANGRIVKNIPVAKRPRRLALTPDGAELWVTSELGSSVSVISTRDLAVTHTIKLEVKGMRADDISPVGIAMAPDGKTAYVGLGRANHVAWVDVASKKQTGQVLVGKRAWGVTLTRDGSRLYVTNGLSDDMTVIDVPSAKALKTIPVGRVPYGVLVDD